MNTTTNQEHAHRKHIRRFITPALALAVGIVLGFLFMSLLLPTARANFWERVIAVVTGRTTHFDTTSPAVVEKIRQLARLETVEYSLDKVVEADKQSPYLPDFLAGDKMLLVAHGEVIAGVDLALLKADDVMVNGNAVRVRLPAPQVLTTRIDNARTRVYSRTTGLFVVADPNLEGQVRETAERQIGEAALTDGILDKARQNARTSVTGLLYGLGFKTVDVQ